MSTMLEAVGKEFCDYFNEQIKKYEGIVEFLERTTVNSVKEASRLDYENVKSGVFSLRLLLDKYPLLKQGNAKAGSLSKLLYDAEQWLSKVVDHLWEIKWNKEADDEERYG